MHEIGQLAAVGAWVVLQVLMPHGCIGQPSAFRSALGTYEHGAGLAHFTCGQGAAVVVATFFFTTTGAAVVVVVGAAVVVVVVGATLLQR
jgi:hypothetical protein